MTADLLMNGHEDLAGVNELSFLRGRSHMVPVLERAPLLQRASLANASLRNIQEPPQSLGAGDQLGHLFVFILNAGYWTTDLRHLSELVSRHKLQQIQINPANVWPGRVPPMQSLES